MIAVVPPPQKKNFSIASFIQRRNYNQIFFLGRLMFFDLNKSFLDILYNDFSCLILLNIYESIQSIKPYL